MNLLFYGDSITDMHRLREQLDLNSPFLSGMGYFFLINAELKSRDANYNPINKGISGNRVVDLYARIKQDCWNLNPDVITILIGVNDVWHEIFDHNGVDIERFDKVYRMLIDDTLKVLPNVKFIIMEPFILHGDATNDHFEEFTDVYNYAKIVRKIAKDYNFPLVELQEPFNEAIKNGGDANYLYDGVHPSPAGAKLIADKWLETFDKYFK